jgi:hypothetical protein
LNSDKNVKFKDTAQTATETPRGEGEAKREKEEERKAPDSGPSPLVQFMLRLSTQLFQPLDYTNVPSNTDSTDSTDSADSNNTNYTNNTTTKQPNISNSDKATT